MYKKIDNKLTNLFRIWFMFSILNVLVMNFVTYCRSDDSRGYNQFIYNALVGLKENDVELVNTSIAAARLSVFYFTVLLI